MHAETASTRRLTTENFRDGDFPEAILLMRGVDVTYV
jgi:hypothetical protein